MLNLLRRLSYGWIVLVLFTTALAENPLGKPAAEQRPFAGTFTGENIALDMNYDAAQEAYTGWLTFNGKKYACGGWVQNSQLSGQFVADGEKFPFSIGINGNDVTLTSAGQHYALKRQGVLAPAGGNPLGGGAAPAPVNPLGGGGGGGANPNPPANNNTPGGVGIMFQQNADGELIISQILPGSPAAAAGLKPGLYLMAVDGKSVEKMSPDQLRALVVGPVGSKLTLTVEDDNDKQTDVALTRADIAALMGGNRPAPGPQPAPMPGPQPEPAPRPGPGPFGPGGNNDQAPAWMKPGVRLTFWSGSATVPGQTTVLSPDDNGNWVAPDGSKYSPQDNPGAGGYGYQQLTVASVNNNMCVVDARSFLIHPENQACSSMGATGYVLPVNNGGDYWGDPRQLQQMQPGNQGGVRVFRGQYKLGDKTYNVVRITTKVATGWTQTTYDLDSGIVLSMGSCTVGAATMTPGANGYGQTGAGNTQIVQGFLVGVRQTNLPWIGQRGSRELANLRAIEFSGSYSTAVPQVPTIQWGYGLRWDISKIDEWSVQMKQSSAIDYKNGARPEPQSFDRAGSLSTFWINPQILAKLQQGQVLDEDPYSKHKLSVGGVQNGNVIIAEQSQLENSAAAYDARTGMISGIQLQQQVGIGTTTISAQRTQ